LPKRGEKALECASIQVMMRIIEVPITTERSTFQVNKRDHNILLRDKQNLDARLARKRFEDQPDTVF
jgi:hypothetical protein